MKTLSIYFIGTSKYIEFFPKYYELHSRHLFPGVIKNFLVFTDEVDHPYFQKENVKTFKINHEPWPFVTLNRFKYIHDHHSQCPSADWHLFIDADLWSVTDIQEEDLLSPEKPYLGVRHPGFLKGNPGSFETNPNSTASITDKEYDLSIYRQGCLWGGKGEHFFKLIKSCLDRVKIDTANKVVASWHDESHLNYFFLNQPHLTHTAPATFAVPQHPGPWDEHLKGLKTQMLHLAKDPTNFPRFEGGEIK